MVVAIIASLKREEDQRYLSGSNIFEAIRVDTKLVLGPGAGSWCMALISIGSGLHGFVPRPEMGCCTSMAPLGVAGSTAAARMFSDERGSLVSCHRFVVWSELE